MPREQMVLKANGDIQFVFKLQAECQLLWQALKSRVQAAKGEAVMNEAGEP